MKQLFVCALAVVCITSGLRAQGTPPPAGGTPPSRTGAPPPASTGTPKPPVATGPATPATAPTAAQAAGGVVPPADYVIGSGDVLQISVWREPDMSAEVMVRPDGRISLPLLNEVTVVGMTTDQLREKLTTDAKRYIQDPVVNVGVKQINSRQVSISGQVAKSGTYPLLTSMTVLQLIATAGGLNEYAKQKDIMIIRTENGQTKTFRFNYDEVSHGKNLKQNIDLKPGDQVIVR